MWRGFAFGACISLTSLVTRAVCPHASFAPSTHPLQPPGWVFSVVWPLLYVTTGAAWQRAAGDDDATFVCLTALCCAWLPLYTCLRAYALALVVLVAATITAARAAVGRRLLAPLAAWLGFATLLSAH